MVQFFPPAAGMNLLLGRRQAAGGPSHASSGRGGWGGVCFGRGGVRAGQEEGREGVQTAKWDMRGSGRGKECIV